MARAIDPVCGMAVNPKTAIAKTDYRSQTYYFCSEQCATSFRADPERFIGAGPAAAQGASAEDVERHEPPFTKQGGITAPKFGAAGSGGAEYEQTPERHRDR